MSKSVEMTLVNNVASQFNARVKAVGLMYRGGHHVLKLRNEAPDLKTSKRKLRAALKASGFRLQRGGHLHGSQGLSFYVIRGDYNSGQLAVIEFDGTSAKPELCVTFGG